LRWTYYGNDVVSAIYEASVSFSGTINFEYDVNTHELNWSGSRSGSSIIDFDQTEIIYRNRKAGAGHSYVDLYLSVKPTKLGNDYVMETIQYIGPYGEEFDITRVRANPAFVFNGTFE